METCRRYSISIRRKAEYIEAFISLYSVARSISISWLRLNGNRNSGISTESCYTNHADSNTIAYSHTHTETYSNTYTKASTTSAAIGSATTCTSHWSQREPVGI